MFEEVAKERSETYFKERCYKRNKWADAHDLENMWEDGAEFGYDKAKEEAEEIILKLSACLESHSNNHFECELLQEAEQFLKED